MRILLLATLMIFTFSASAGLYKWVDAEGNVHYSQKRPRETKYTKIKPPAAPAESSKPLYSSGKTSTTPKTAITSENAKNEKIRADNCAKAKKNLNSYTVYRRFRDKEGNVKVIDDQERARQIEVSQKAINDFC
ncbi:MAG: DUF4124 domain-containing protein [Woeseiaceae bacterium]